MCYVPFVPCLLSCPKQNCCDHVNGRLWSGRIKRQVLQIKNRLTVRDRKFNSTSRTVKRFFIWSKKYYLITVASLTLIMVVFGIVGNGPTNGSPRLLDLLVHTSMYVWSLHRVQKKWNFVQGLICTGEEVLSRTNGFCTKFFFNVHVHEPLAMEKTCTVYKIWRKCDFVHRTPYTVHDKPWPYIFCLSCFFFSCLAVLQNDTWW